MAVHKPMRTLEKSLQVGKVEFIFRRSHEREGDEPHEAQSRKSFHTSVCHQIIVLAHLSVVPYPVDLRAT